MKFISDTVYSVINILIGDAWLCSGQSNMEWTVMISFNSGCELKSADIKVIRYYSMSKIRSLSPSSNTSPAQWDIITLDNAVFSSGVAYFFQKLTLKAKDTNWISH